MAKILVVDDEIALCKIIERTLSNEEHEVFLAHDGKEALKRLYTVSPDLIILDVMMPGMDGFEVCSKVREDPFYNELPIIMLTGETSKEDELKAYDSGADVYMEKPFHLSDLLSKINIFIDDLNK